jgi:drug/metabolite transporter (DMT)-like permease
MHAMPSDRRALRRRYAWRVFTASAGYVVTLLAAVLLIEKRGLDGPPAVVLALLPAVCVAGIFWAMARLLVEEQDEYMRTLLVRQLLVASGLMLTVATFWGFLEQFGFVPHVPAWYAILVFFIGQCIGALVNKLTLGDAGGCY